MSHRRRKARRVGTRLLFATDIHGSEACFRKLLNAPPVYRTPLLVLGGDITGKLLVPVVDHGGRYSCRYGERVYHDLDETGKRELLQAIRRFGHYPVTGDVEETARLDDPEYRDAVFRRTVYRSIEEWVGLAEERLRGTGCRLFMAPGNDDFLEIDGALQGSDIVEFAEGKRLWLDEHHEMITTGYSNPTPWLTDRELPEDQLQARLDAMLVEVGDAQNLVAVIHPPPYDSGLDSAPELDEEFGVHVQLGVGVITAPVGSTAVRTFIENAQPLLSLHGHVHEAGGATHIGRTLCLNPGSAYTSGTLASAIVELDVDRVISHQFVAA
jgi:Icc-related predicted phosphoesterase